MLFLPPRGHLNRHAPSNSACLSLWVWRCLQGLKQVSTGCLDTNCPVLYTCRVSKNPICCERVCVFMAWKTWDERVSLFVFETSFNQMLPPGVPLCFQHDYETVFIGFRFKSTCTSVITHCIELPFTLMVKMHFFWQVKWGRLNRKGGETNPKLPQKRQGHTCRSLGEADGTDTLKTDCLLPFSVLSVQTKHTRRPYLPFISSLLLHFSSLSILLRLISDTFIVFLYPSCLGLLREEFAAIKM